MGRSLAGAAAHSDAAGVVNATAAFAGQFNATTVQAKAFGFAACAVGMQTGVDVVFRGAHDVAKTNFLPKADALCRAMAPQLKAFEATDINSLAELLRFLDKGLELQRKLVADLAALPVPPGDEQTLKDVFASLNAGVAKICEARTAASRGDRASFEAAGDALDRLSADADVLLDGYGLGVCGSDFGET